MSDLIRREDAIKAIERIFDRCEEIENHLPKDDPDRIGYKMFPDYMTVWKYLHQLQSAELKERTAKVKEGWGLAMCCACENRVLPKEKYCPNCGCRLEWK